LRERRNLRSLVGLAEATLAAAPARSDRRGVHFREDFPNRIDDVHFE
jgi:succinate dehydrogenase/fumarate reductase flavoprotein subunit